VSRRVEISLIITCYNQRPLIELVLQSAIAQQVGVPFEILICDDGSNDGVLDTIRACAESGIDIRYIWQPDRGFRAARSRNNGIRCARGRLLVFVDGDTWMSPTLLHDHLQAHQVPYTLGCGVRQTLVTDLWDTALKARVQAVAAQPARGEIDHQRRWLASASPWMACLSGNFSVPRSARVYFDEAFESWGSEDRDLAFRLWRARYRPRLLNGANAVHVRRPNDGLALSHGQVVALIENKRLLRSKYPRGEMTASIDMVRNCHLDPRTGVWSFGPRRDASAETVFSEFSTWKARGSCE